jgi:EAL domain-containing protein (putative c-di-GMP-specific phosphodiesterase class I)/GGDEF domain-containing protein
MPRDMSYEVERLNALKALNLLNTPPAESFDRITRMAAQIFGLPIAAVSLTDADRQWFKSRVGVDHQEIPRELAPCGEVADSCGPLVIRDFQADAKYRDSVLGQSGVRFYAGAPLTTSDGYTLGAMCVLGTEPRDITEQETKALSDLAAMVMAQIELQHAFGRVDASTGLSNRNQMVEDIEDAARDQPGGERVAVFIDLLPVEQLSDSLRVLGPSFADDLAASASRLLKDSFRDTKLYHIDHTHFGLVLNTLSPEEIYGTAECIRATLVNSHGRDAVSLPFRPAIGMAPFRLGVTTAKDVLRTARSAAQDARDLQRPVAIYSDDQDEAHRRRFKLVADMPNAIAAPDQLRLVFQPRLDFKSGACVGAEALLRWVHPELGSVPPAEFIPIIEKAGLARAVTDWVLDAALSHIAAWNAEGRRLQISINISASNLDEEDFSERVVRRVQQSGTPPGSMELEVTESALIRNGDRALAHLNVLRFAGVNIAVDDFGTGYSSLAYLKRIPAHIVKIDRSFVQEMERAEKDLLLVTSMIGMLQGLGFRVVAEGIETAEAYRLLAQAGCDEAQGYYLAKPLEFAAFERWLSEAQKARA